MFTPHKFEPVFNGLPSIQIAEQALIDMWYITSIVEMEVGWWCLTRELEDNQFLVEEVFLPKQECHSTTTEIIPEGEFELISHLNAKDVEEGVDIFGPAARVSRMNAWFHSHVNMGTSPSGQDLSQVDFYRKRSALPWFIRGIVNKGGRVELAFYDFRSSLAGTRIEDVPWTVKPMIKAEPVEDPRKAHWREQTKAKVSHLTYQHTHQSKAWENPYSRDYSGYEYGYNYGRRDLDTAQRFVGHGKHKRLTGP
jgi:proteasome lid subunit RPN8/RPN11